MTNLLSETIAAIHNSGHSEQDIVFIGSEKSGHQCSWEEYCVLANQRYNSSYGAQEVATDLIIVFSDGQKMWRGEYDGSEWWNYSKPFVRPEKTLPIRALLGGCWSNLAELSQED